MARFTEIVRAFFQLAPCPFKVTAESYCEYEQNRFEERSLAHGLVDKFPWAS